MVADLLEFGEQLEHQAAAGDALGPSDAAEDLVSRGAVEAGLLGGEQHHVFGLGLRRKFRSDQRVRLVAAQQERGDHPVEPGGYLGVAIALDRNRHAPAELVDGSEQSRRRPVDQ